MVDGEPRRRSAVLRELRRFSPLGVASHHDGCLLLGELEPRVVVAAHALPDGRGTQLLACVRRAWPRCERVLLAPRAAAEALGQAFVYPVVAHPWPADALFHLIARLLRQGS